MSDQDKTNTSPFPDTSAKKTTTTKTAKKAKRGRKAKAKTPQQPDLSDREVVILNPDGTDEVAKFEVSKVTSKCVFLKPLIEDKRSIMIGGEMRFVDLNQLKRMSPDATMFDKPVSAIITAIELAE